MTLEQLADENDDCYLIPTLEGTMRFERGAMLITGVKGEVYPCARDIFDATYELAKIHRITWFGMLCMVAAHIRRSGASNAARIKNLAWLLPGGQKR